jgi:MFS family permease
MSSRPVADPSTMSRCTSWRTPAVIVICGCVIAMISFGPRATLGFFLTPMSAANGWGREVFALSVAMQTLLYGAAQPFSGAIADRFGTVRVRTGSYDVVWWLGVLFGVLSALINLPIVEKPVQRAVATA